MVIYFKNSFIKKKEIVSEINDLHFKYGFGFFETVLYNGLNICYLEKHITRLEFSLKDFGFKVYSEGYGLIIKELLSANKLINKLAKIYIYALVINNSKYEILITCSKYTPPEFEPVELLISPHIHLSYLNRYKTLNHMHFYLAKEFATSNKKYDAVLCDNNKNILECTSSAILFSDGKNFYTSNPINRLPSISLEIVRERYGLNEINIYSGNLEKYKNIYIVNSLIGCLPVSKIDNLNFETDKETAKNLKQLITN
jgi:4-amino-4-deoxychorismate lyase